MIEIDLRKCAPDPLTFFADRAILGRLGCSVEPALDRPHLEGPPIRKGAAEAKQEALVHASKR